MVFQDKESVGTLVKLIDKTNGYIFAGIDATAVEFSKIAVGPVDWDYYRYPFPTLAPSFLVLFSLAYILNCILQYLLILRIYMSKIININGSFEDGKSYKRF